MTDKKNPYWTDPRVPGLRRRDGVRASVWSLAYRTKSGRQRQLRLGDAADMSLKQARARAHELLAEVAAGKDPAEKNAVPTVEAPDMEKLKQWHIERHCEIKNKPSWVRDVDSIYRNHILPKIGARKAVADVTVADIEDMHFSMRGTPYLANRAAAVLHKAFNLAERWGWRERGTNPVIVERYREQKRRRVPRAEEAVRLLIAMDSMRDSAPWFIGLIELLCLTGARLNEIKSAKWEWVQDDGLHLPDSKTGEKVVALSTLAREALAQIPRVEGNPYIIIGQRKGRHLVNVVPQWERLMIAANITENLRRHDLRRFFASAGLSGGLELSQIGSLLGHMSPITTKRYAYLLTDEATAAAERVSRNVHAIMTGAGKVHALNVAR
ncbi:integrase family protein [Breoghania sp.]|uniref:integrase family protein n=1 Tax=Breoghania sp. TaxID=2065378 RepID=UPI002AA6914A|nr:integrase family protein [Breoghania sp.]